jgi:hypothetical protein
LKIQAANPFKEHRLMRLATLLLLAVAILCFDACRIPSVQSGPQNPVEGKWRSTDGSFVVEFLPTGDCSAHMRMQGHDVGGPCKYTVDQSAITIHYFGMGANTANGPNQTATWNYTQSGDTMTVTVFGNSLKLQRAH